MLLNSRKMMWSYFHCETRGHHVFGPFKVRGVNSCPGLDQEDSFAVRSEEVV